MDLHSIIASTQNYADNFSTKPLVLSDPGNFVAIDKLSALAVWAERQNNGKSSWFTEDFFPDGGTDKETPIFGDEQRARLAEIAALDANAILLNGYYDSWIGSADEPLNAASIAEGLKKHYDMHNGLIRGCLSDEGETDGAEGFPTSGENESAESDIIIEETPSQTELTDMGDTDETDEKPENAAETNVATNATADGATLIIDYPLRGFTPESIENLGKMVTAKTTLIKKAIGADETNTLPIQVISNEDVMRFPWFRFTQDGATFQVYATFIERLCKTALKKKRVTAKERADGEIESEKFAFRVFLLGLGMVGGQYREVRRVLLKNLGGNSSFSTNVAYNAMQEKRRKTAVDANYAVEGATGGDTENDKTHNNESEDGNNENQ